MVAGVTGNEDKDLSGDPAWKMTGTMPAEGRMDDDEANTNLIYRGEGSGRLWSKKWITQFRATKWRRSGR